MMKLIKSFGFAVKGIRAVWREELNFRIEVAVAVLVVVIGVWRQFLLLEWMIVVGCIGAVLAAEMVNTAMEDLCDRVEPKTDPVIGKVKDMMGGFVLVVATGAVLVGGMLISTYF
jgi:diacylglycerol kinase (ATP)